MKDILRFALGVGMLVGLVALQGVVNESSINVPEKGVYHVVNEDDGTAITLYEDAIVMTKYGKEHEFFFEDIQSSNRNYTQFKITKKDGSWMIFSFAYLPEAKRFQKLMKKHMDLELG